MNLWKNLFFCAVATLVVSAAAVVGVKAYNYSQMSDLALANIEALSSRESDMATVMDWVCKKVGCCGGPNNCFSGKLNIYGVSIEGTFYMK